jgi:hypothetical protein
MSINVKNIINDNDKQRINWKNLEINIDHSIFI